MLTLVFATVALVVALYMGLARADWRLTDRLPEGPAKVLPTSTLLAAFGARLAHGLNTRHLKRVFAVFLGVTALRMF